MHVCVRLLSLERTRVCSPPPLYPTASPSVQQPSFRELKTTKEVKEFIEKMEGDNGAAFILFKPEEPGEGYSELEVVYVCVYIYICIHVCVFVCVYICIGEGYSELEIVCVCLYICIHVCMCVCAYICIGEGYSELEVVCVFVYIYIHVCVCVCVHMYRRGLLRA